MSLVWDLDFDPKEKLVLLALADHANDHGGRIYPGMALLSHKTSVPERTLQRIIGGLIDRGVIARVLRRNEDTPKTKGQPAKPLRYEYRLSFADCFQAPEPDYSKCPGWLRVATIEAFMGVCQYCGHHGSRETGPDGKSWHIDRIVPGSRGGRYAPENVTLACHSCNSSKGAKEVSGVRCLVDAEPPIDDMDEGRQNGTPATRQNGTTTGAKMAPPGVPKQASWGAKTIEGGAKTCIPTLLEPSVEPPRESSGARKRATTLPDDFQVTPTMIKWADGFGLSGDRIKAATDHFKDHHTAKGSTFKDWSAAWRTWIRNEIKFNGRSAKSTTVADHNTAAAQEFLRRRGHAT